MRRPGDPRAPSTPHLAATSMSLAVTSAAAHQLSQQIAIAQIAPELVSFSSATREQLEQVLDASDELARTCLGFLEAVRPELVAGARERMAMAAAESEHALAHAFAEPSAAQRTADA